MNSRPWTPEEDAAVRAAVGKRRARTSVGWERLAQTLGRTVAAVHARARTLGLSRPGARWTRAEDAVLRAKWCEVAMRVLRQHLPHRSTRAIICRAQTLGLGAQERRQGLLSISAAAERAGYPEATLRRLLIRQEVPMHRVGVTLRDAPRTNVRHVEWEDVVAAIERETQLESVRAAADRLGVSKTKLRDRLRRAGIVLVRGASARLAPEVFDQLVARAA